MKTFLQNLLITFALALCVLIAIQWHRESNLRDEADKLAEAARKDQQAMESLRADLKRTSDELARVEAVRKQLAEAGSSSRIELERITRELKRAETELQRLARELAPHKTALLQANENITTQNETLKNLAGERDAAVAKFNQLVEDHNALVKQWNVQQEQITKPRTR